MADGHCWLTVAASCACMLGELQLCRGGPLHWIRDAARVAAAMAGPYSGSQFKEDRC